MWSPQASPIACEVQFAYAIGHPDPVSVSIDTFCTGKVDEEKLERAVCEVFNFKPAEIIRQLNLLRPIYRKTTNYGHFGPSMISTLSLGSAPIKRTN